MDAKEILLLDIADSVATITLNRPEARNAMSPELIDAIYVAVAQCEADPAVAAMVLTGSDPAFCAGIDLKRLSSGSKESLNAVITKGPLGEHTKPIIGAINGATVTGGLELALACDFLIASEHARFADTHARVGVMPGWGLTVRLPEAIGMRRALQMSLTGNYVDAATALAWGLVNEVVPHDDVVTRAQQLARDSTTIPLANVTQLRAIYLEVAAHNGADAWDTEQRHSLAWMKETFDRDRLAKERETIQSRGRGQL